MPYQVTAERPPYRYIQIVPRCKLASTIIEQLIALGFSLNDFNQLIEQNHLSHFHILSDQAYQTLISKYPEMDFIYAEIRLLDQTRMHYHTNWTVSSHDWQTLSKKLAEFNIFVETIKTADTQHNIKYKEPL